MTYRFNPPPNWPRMPAGWVPPQGWQPPANWPQLPESWQLWVSDTARPNSGHDVAGGPSQQALVPPVATPTPLIHNKSVGFFGARKKLQQVESELRIAQDQDRRLQDMIHTEKTRATQLEAQLQEANARNTALTTQTEDLAKRYVELQGKDAATLEKEIQEARLLLTRLATEAESRRAASAQEQNEAVSLLSSVQNQINTARSELEIVRGEIVETQDIALLQEAGIYEYRHRLADAVAYKASLEELKDAIKYSAKNNHAITATTNWTVNNSAVEGQRMVRDFSKLMLRAYNTEADNCVRAMRPYRLESSKDRLNKAREIVSKLGKTMHINISSQYHKLRLRELELTSDYLAKVEEEKERIRAERERQRDELQARREFEREKARLDKEKSHWENAMQKWASAGDITKTAEAQAKLEELGEAIKGVEEREANIRTGWVYVISNIGSFGQDVVKIGLTRRLDPMERVRELGDASVPFKFDVHALIFNADAVSLETHLHQRLTDQRVNRINLRREFFYATPAEVLEILRDMGLQDNLVDYVQEPEAQEWRSSQQISNTTQNTKIPNLDTSQ
ncbi:DUF4041 domain-containing protein [Kutzneria viridogrisea]|uniref:Bacteriophage T5 Orf172 DNA-binding domain-containing protein n=1 Tax=Kutzneria viridogrisea TaxID=47990 RepID=A0ABR6BEK5_9PSEU|nr:hypothetical protein [Kutzneria viridogrisea]